MRVLRQAILAFGAVAIFAAALIGAANAQTADKRGPSASTKCVEQREGFSVRTICVTKQIISLNPGTAQTLTMICPGSYLIVTGGYQAAELPQSVVVSESYPGNIHNWRMTVANRGTTTARLAFTTRILCAKPE